MRRTAVTLIGRWIGRRESGEWRKRLCLTPRLACDAVPWLSGDSHGDNPTRVMEVQRVLQGFAFERRGQQRSEHERLTLDTKSERSGDVAVSDPEGRARDLIRAVVHLLAVLIYGAEHAVGREEVGVDLRLSPLATGTQVLVQDTSTRFTRSVSVTNNTGVTAMLMGWIDFNENGAFDNNEVDTVLD